MVLMMAVDEAGNFGYRPLLEAMYAALTEMVKEGFVRPEEVRRMVIPTVGRSRADLVAPFAENGCFADLSIEQLEVFLGEDRIWRNSRTAVTPRLGPMGRFARFGVPTCAGWSGERSTRRCRSLEKGLLL